MNFNQLEVELTDKLCNISEYFDGLRNNISNCYSQIINVPHI